MGSGVGIGFKDAIGDFLGTDLRFGFAATESLEFDDSPQRRSRGADDGDDLRGSPFAAAEVVRHYRVCAPRCSDKTPASKRLRDLEPTTFTCSSSQSR